MHGDELKSVPLSYSKSAVPGVLRRSRLWLVCVIAAAATVALWRAVGPMWERIDFLVAQHQCLEYRLPPDTPVFRRGSAIPTGGPAGLVYTPRVQLGAWLNPPVFADRIMGVDCVAPNGNTFLHGRCSPHGTKRLVTVNATDVLRCGSRAISSMGQDMSLLARSYSDGRGVSLQLRDPDELTVFAGQPDPNDESHFTIDVLVNGVRSTLDGRLADDGIVALLPRDGLVGDAADLAPGGALKWWPRGSTAPVSQSPWRHPHPPE